MKNSEYTYTFRAEIFRQSFRFESEKVKKLVETKRNIIQSIEKNDAQLTPRQYSYCEVLRSEGAQLLAIIEAGENLCGSFLENLEKLADENTRLFQEIEKLKSIVRSQESQITVLQFIIEKKNRKEVRIAN